MFWDSSAVIACLVMEKQTRACIRLLGHADSVTLWWATPVECVSAIERSRREGRIMSSLCRIARRRLAAFVEQANIVLAHDSVRDRAIRLLAVHPLRASDSLQLAAALVVSEERPQAVPFVTLDDRLREAAHREGFCVQPE